LFTKDMNIFWIVWSAKMTCLCDHLFAKDMNIFWIVWSAKMTCLCDHLFAKDMNIFWIVWSAKTCKSVTYMKCLYGKTNNEDIANAIGKNSVP